jgi:hypothetical protein
VQPETALHAVEVPYVEQAPAVPVHPPTDQEQPELALQVVLSGKPEQEELYVPEHPLPLSVQPLLKGHSRSLNPEQLEMLVEHIWPPPEGGTVCPSQP